jgi:hypothetical protein
MADPPFAAFTPYLEPGEQLKYVAYGIRQPNLLVTVLFLGVLARALLTKYYLVGLTDRRLIMLRFSGNVRGNITVKEIVDYRLENIPPITASSGRFWTNIKIFDPAKAFPIVIKCHRRSFDGKNGPNAEAIAAALAGQTAAQADGAEVQPLAQAAAAAAENGAPASRSVSKSPAQLVIKIGTVTRPVVVGTTIEPMHLGRAGAGRGKGPVAEIVADATDAGRLKLRNLAYRRYQAKQPGGQVIDVGPGQLTPLAAGVVIDFDGIEGVVTPNQS